MQQQPSTGQVAGRAIPSAAFQPEGRNGSISAGPKPWAAAFISSVTVRRCRGITEQSGGCAGPVGSPSSRKPPGALPCCARRQTWRWALSPRGPACLVSRQEGSGWVEAPGNAADWCFGESKELLWFPAPCRLTVPVGPCSPEAVQLLVTQSLPCSGQKRCSQLVTGLPA